MGSITTLSLGEIRAMDYAEALGAAGYDVGAVVGFEGKSFLISRAKLPDAILIGLILAEVCEQEPRTA